MDYNENLDLDDIIYYCQVDNVFKTEQWKDIPNYIGLYKISDLGRVKSLSYRKTHIEGIMAGSLGKRGYRIVKLSKNNSYRSIQVHQLVAMAFLNHKPCGYELVVNHKDFNRLNNVLKNLEIVTSRENTNKKHIESSSKYVGVCWNKKKNKWQSRILIKNRQKHLGFFDDELEASEFYNNAVISLNNNQDIKVKERSYKSKLKGVG